MYIRVSGIFDFHQPWLNYRQLSHARGSHKVWDSSPLALESAGDGDPVNADGGTNGDGGPTGSTLRVPVRRKWREEHDKMALDAIRGAKAHTAAHGQKLKRFEEAADVFNQHPRAIFDVNAKALS